jgi:hypothetical protein
VSEETFVQLFVSGAMGVFNTLFILAMLWAARLAGVYQVFDFPRPTGLQMAGLAVFGSFVVGMGGR